MRETLGGNGGASSSQLISGGGIFISWFGSQRRT